MTLLPRSFPGLLIAGFLALAVPLGGALVTSSVLVERLARHSQDALFTSVQYTDGARSLTELLLHMERSARQYLVLNDASRLAAYETAHQAFRRTAAEMANVQHARDKRAELEALARDAEILFNELTIREPEDETGDAVSRFADLAERARNIVSNSNQLVSQHVHTLRGLATETKRVMFWQSMTLIPVALLLTLAFMRLVASPIRQLDRAIRSLAEPNADTPIQVLGPRDLEALGERLEWLRTRLRGLEEEKNQFLRHISHELKTPLAALREGADLLAQEVTGSLNGEQMEIARILQGSAQRLHRLIDDLLAFNRLGDLRDGTTTRAQVSLATLVEEVVADHRAGILGRRLEVDLDLAPVTVLSDRTRLRTIVDNFVSNAVKYSPREGRISVRLNHDEQDVTLVVADQGAGVENKDRAHIFDAFYQGELQPGGPVSGTGLGLAIARECAAALGGEVGVLDPDDGGTRFQFRLPGAVVLEHRP